MAGDLNVPGPLVPSGDYVTDEARILDSINTNHATLLSAILTTLRDCRHILQTIADKSDG